MTEIFVAAECRLRKSRKLLISELYSILSNDSITKPCIFRCRR